MSKFPEVKTLRSDTLENLALVVEAFLKTNDLLNPMAYDVTYLQDLAARDRDGNCAQRWAAVIIVYHEETP